MRLSGSITYLLFTIFIYICVTISGQTNELSFEHITTNHGISHNKTLCLLKDSRGYMWFGTQDGLNRYDGYNFTTFFKENEDPSSLSDNIIISLFEDSEGILWVGTSNGGLNKFNPEMENFTHFQHHREIPHSIGHNDIRAMEELPDGRLVIGTYGGGISIFDKKTETFKHIKKKTTKGHCPNLNKTTALLLDSSGELWVGTDGAGIYQLNLSDLSITRFTLPREIQISPLTKKIKALIETPDGTLWIATQFGLCQLSHHNKKSTLFIHDDKNPTSLKSNCISGIQTDKSGNLWVSTSAGLSVLTNQLNPEKQFTHYQHDPFNSQSISDNAVRSLYIDNNNILWAGTFTRGLNNVQLNNGCFNHVNHRSYDPASLSNKIVRSCLEDSQGNLWIGTDGGGLNFQPKNSNTFIHFNYPPTTYPQMNANHITCLSEDGKGNIWIGTWGDGLVMLHKNDIPNIVKGKLPPMTHYKRSATNKAAISSNIIQSIFEDSKQNLWIGTENGLNLLNKKNNTFTTFKHFNTQPNSLSDNRIQSQCIFEDSQNNLWIGTWNGLNRINTKNIPFRQGAPLGNQQTDLLFQRYLHHPNDTCSLSDSRILCLYQATDNTLWAGTHGGGVNQLYTNPLNPKFRRYTLANGLPNNVIFGILEDNHQHLWMSTNKGLSMFDCQNQTFRNFDQSDGLQGKEFYWGAHFKRQNGQLIFGGTNGYNDFFPDSIVTNNTPPKVILTDLKIFNKTVNFRDSQSPLSKPINLTSNVTLTQKESVISISYAALNFQNQHKNTYAYKLEGFEEHWNYVGKQRTATYTNLEQGNYTFKVISSNNQDTWNKEGTSLQIKINAPFYRTIWFRVITLTFFITIFLSWLLLKMKNIKIQKRTLKIMVEQRTSELRKSNLLLENRNRKITRQKEEIHTKHKEVTEKNNMILEQNRELEMHRNNLEKLINERTGELVKAKEKAEESDQLKSAFLANMSHEIRTPLNAIIGFSELIDDDTITREDKSLFINQINKNTEALLLLIDDILDLSYIEAGQIQLNNTPFDVNCFLEEIIAIFQSTQTPENVRVILNNNEITNQLQLSSDAHRVRQILLNLISNAIKFTEKGSITLGLEHKNNQLLFTVKDTGIGIAKEHLPVIFDRFRKIENNATKIYRGSGLGLSISKKLAKLLHANLWVDSEVGIGSTFYLSFSTTRVSTAASLQ